MILELPLDLQKLILSYLTRKEYKVTVPCKALLLCESYLSIEDYCELDSFPIVNLTPLEKETLLHYSFEAGNVYLIRWLMKHGVSRILFMVMLSIYNEDAFKGMLESLNV